MAEKKAAEKDEAEGGKGNLKKLIIIGGVVAVLLIGGIVAWLMMRGGDKEAEANETEKHEVVPAIYESLGDKFTVALQFEGRQHYMQLTLSVLTHEPAVAEDLKVHAPLIRGSLVTLLGSQDFAAMRTDAGKQALRGQILKAIQAILEKETGKKGIEQVYFTDFVLQ